MFHPSEGAPRVVDHYTPHCGLQGVEDAHSIVKGQSHHQALLWQVAHMGDGSVMNPTASQHTYALWEELKRQEYALEQGTFHML